MRFFNKGRSAIAPPSFRGTSIFASEPGIHTPWRLKITHERKHRAYGSRARTKRRFPE